MAYTNVYQGSYDDLSEITVNAENMKSAINALDAIRTDREPTMLRRKISGIRIPDPPPPTPTVTVHTRATMTEESTIPLPSTVTVRPEHAVVEVGSSVLLYAIDLSTEPTVDFVGWFLNDTLVSFAPNFAYDIPTTAEGELLFVARYAEKIPVPTVTIKTQATITEGAILPDTVSTKPDCVKVSVGSTVYIGTKDTAEKPTVDFVGWFLNDTLISEDKVFEYVVPESEEPIIFEARYIEKAPISYVNVVAQATMLYPNQILPDTVVTSPDNVVTIKGSTVVLKTEDTASDSLIAFVGWYLNNKLVSDEAEFVYTVDTDAETLVFTAKYRMVQQALTIQGKVIANLGDLWLNSETSLPYDSNAIRQDNGVFIALSAVNEINPGVLLARSDDGKHWTTHTITNAHLNQNAKGAVDIVYVNGIWFTLRLNKTFVSLDNGITWVEALFYDPRGNLVSSSSNKIVHANDVEAFVAATDNGVFYSIDGLRWTQTALNISEADSLCYAPDAESPWVVIGNDGSHTYCWSGEDLNDLGRAPRSHDDDFTSDVQYANGVWVAIGTMLSVSVDAFISYDEYDIVTEPIQILYAENAWWVCAENGLFRSTNAEDWLNVGATQMYCQLLYTGREFLRVSASGLECSADGGMTAPWELVTEEASRVAVSSDIWIIAGVANILECSESGTYPIDDYATIEPSGTIQAPISVEQELTGTAVQRCHFDHWEDAEGTTLSTDNPYYYTPTAESPLSNTIVAVFQAGNSEEGGWEVEE